MQLYGSEAFKLLTVSQFLGKVQDLVGLYL